MSLDIDKTLSKWWGNQLQTSKVAFFSTLIVGFFSHLFVYTGRYFGDHDMGMVLRPHPNVASGRWLSTIINQISFGYVIPYTSGIFVSLFLAISAFYICNLFKINSKMNSFLIGSLLATFPTISVTNLFLYDSPNYHFGVLLAVIAVYITTKYKFGLLIGAFLLMCTLAIYQSKLNIAVMLCLLIIVKELLCIDFNINRIKNLSLRFSLLGILGGLLYVISLPLSTYIFGIQLTGYKGMSSESIGDRLFSASALINALKSTYFSFIDGFVKNFYFYLYIDIIRLAYLFLFALLLIFLTAIIIKQKIYKYPCRLIALIFMLLIIPLAANFAVFFTEDGMRVDMVYAFVFALIFVIIISESIFSETFNNIFIALKSALVLCIFIIIVYYVMANNTYYLKAYYFNQRTTALTTRIASNIDPLITQTRSDYLAFFGGVPNEYYQVVRNRFTEMDGYSLGRYSFFRMHGDNDWAHWMFLSNLVNLHGIHLEPLLDVGERKMFRDVILTSNIPIWPAKDSINVINDVIVINFGVTDIVYEENKGILRARHWINENLAPYDYEYSWDFYRNGSLINSIITNTNQLNLDIVIVDDIDQITVIIKNINTNFEYPKAEIKLPF